MTLIACPDCGTQVSLDAAACVKCGRPIRTKKKKGEGLFLSTLNAGCVVVFGVVGFLLLMAVLETCSK